MRYVVGYQPDDRGADAIALAVAIARAQGTGLEIVYVVPENAPYVAVNPQGKRVSAGEQEVLTARREALKLVPSDIDAEFRVVDSDSFAEGLIETATTQSAALIVIGAASNGLFKRFSVGSVANALLHASPVPVALAPRGYQRKGPLTRLTAFIGERQGAQTARDVALRAAGRRGLPLRLVSLVALDTHERSDSGEAIHQAHLHANSVLSEAATNALDGTATVTVAHGRTIEEAIDSLDWDDGELVIIGSSRLAQRNRLFLGSTALKVLRALPVPMVVVPQEGVHGLDAPGHV
ncbi:universal stress protein [Arthrobacter crystallopoietes]|uniref:Nucleotide-binding universal stress protein, UspA family n=1 Tax=Crystallibacter crystallopoietes TaxID=37928 RepID=A0A1H1ESS8_9MICC|nr:universal stress protein [Arthrobacter crystallopoietes]AUI49799.1 universal stress protein UspA [Arthrobacter crystallopoietes]SDQ91618.1 Nucleotide-binding universal stress protein, UspA family [Arthrobacter crystallopoietes]